MTNTSTRDDQSVIAENRRASGSKKSKKPARPKARRARGFEDKPAEILRAERELVAKACAVYESHGFQPLETPALEYADALGKFLPDADRPNEGVFAFQDDDEQWLAMRYDLTAPLARHVAENFDQLAKPFRRYQAGPVYRNEKPGPGRFREFIQCDADTVGAAGAGADAEMIALAVKVMRAVGLKDGEFVVRVNDRRLYDGLFEHLGIAPEHRVQTLRSLDKLDKFPPDEVVQLLTTGRKDPSGDFTPGVGLSEAIAQAAVEATASASLNDMPEAEFIERFGDNAQSLAARDRLLDIVQLLSALGVSGKQVAFDTSVVRGLEYYTGPVFEAELLIEVENEKGQPVRVGSVGGGGRYDDLVARFKGQTVPATGFSFGVSRFAAALRLAGRLDAAQNDSSLVVILSVENDQMADYFTLAEQLRTQTKLPVEVFQGGGNMGKQLKYADKRGARFAVIIGEDERKARQVTVKDLALGARLAAQITSNEEWRQDQPAQDTIARGQLGAWIKRAVRAPLPE